MYESSVCPSACCGCGLIRGPRPVDTPPGLCPHRCQCVHACCDARCGALATVYGRDPYFLSPFRAMGVRASTYAETRRRLTINSCCCGVGPTVVLLQRAVGESRVVHFSSIRLDLSCSLTKNGCIGRIMLECSEHQRVVQSF